MQAACFVLLLCLYAAVAQTGCSCNLKGTNITIIDDKDVDAAITAVSEEFLAKQGSPKFNRLAATIMIKKSVAGKPVWMRGSVHPTEIAYPASCVKMTYMLAAIRWCKEQGKPASCLDRHVRPMITISSNLATGFVVDVITNTTNIDDLTSMDDPRWESWIYKRRYTERLLQKLGLYDNQVVLGKTYPTNSGQMPVGAEKVILDKISGNRLQPCCTASLILYIMTQLPQDEFEYAKTLLNHDINGHDAVTGRGLPAGTLVFNKDGRAYDTLEEISYIMLPNGQDIVLSVFTNGYQRGESDYYVLGRFAEMLIARLKLNEGGLPTVYGLPEDLECGIGARKHDTDKNAPDAIGKYYYTMRGTQLGRPDYCSWYIPLKEEGLYSVMIWIPSYNGSMGQASVKVTKAHGTGLFSYDQHASIGSWAPVGDFIFGKYARVTITNEGAESEGTTIVANAVRLSKYPNA
jgi:protein phosphatase methylesterase 1